MPGKAPVERGYHTADVVGDCVYLAGGRNYRSGYPARADLVACFDARQRAWVAPGRVEGTPMSARSSHRCSRVWCLAALRVVALACAEWLCSRALSPFARHRTP